MLDPLTEPRGDEYIDNGLAATFVRYSMYVSINRHTLAIESNHIHTNFQRPVRTQNNNNNNAFIRHSN